jgi:alcohol dehydrogenase, propanol-preferring
MYAMVLAARDAPLVFQERPDPVPGPGEVRVKVSACGVCRTDLHVVDGELPELCYPIIPGHEVVGRIDALGDGVSQLQLGMRVGVPWLGHTCGVCPYCRMGKENLCDRPQFTGYTRDGGFASHLLADARYCFPLGEHGDDAALAPLLCAGLIGWRSLAMAGDGKNLGIYGFGAAGHIVAQIAHAQGRNHLCAGWPVGAAGAQGGAQGRARRLCRDPHVRHSLFSL